MILLSKPQPVKEPSTSEIIARFRNQLAAVDDQARRGRDQVFDMILKQLATQTDILVQQQTAINAKSEYIGTLQGLLKKAKIQYPPENQKPEESKGKVVKVPKKKKKSKKPTR